jgi:biotin transport system ATP-binding protein
MIEIENLEHRYPDGVAALRGVSLTIADGEFIMICGPNGSGKTTLIRHINGLLLPSAGVVRVNGLDTVSRNREVRKEVGMVFQDADSQIVGETVEEDVAFGPENMGLSPAEVSERTASALKAVGLQHLADKSCHLLSGGERRRLAIAGVLAMRPRIILLDEPFANLDYAGVRQTLQQLVNLHREGHTLLVTTHDVEKLIAHADRIIVMQEGELKASGAPETVLGDLPSYGIRPPCYALLGGRALSWLTD